MANVYVEQWEKVEGTEEEIREDEEGWSPREEGGKKVGGMGRIKLRGTRFNNTNTLGNTELVTLYITSESL